MMAENTQILLVEDDVLIAMMLADMLEALGFSVPVQASTLEEAEAAIGSDEISAALVDVNIGDKKIWPFADRLEEKGIPFAFTTGGIDSVPQAYAQHRMIGKPFRLADIDSVLQDMLSDQA